MNNSDITDNSDDIQFEQMNPNPLMAHDVFTPVGDVLKKNNAIEIKEKNYKNLYAELLDKCHPDKFTNREPYDADLVTIAQDILTKLKQHKAAFNVPDDKIPNELHLLRKEAEQKLKIRCSTKRVFEKIKAKINPDKFSHDFKILPLANDLYPRLLKIKDDVDELYNFFNLDEFKNLSGMIDGVPVDDDGGYMIMIYFGISLFLLCILVAIICMA